jgi:hypothetical protein
MAFLVFGEVHHAKAAGRQFLDDLVATDHGARGQRGGFWL